MIPIVWNSFNDQDNDIYTYLDTCLIVTTILGALSELGLLRIYDKICDQAIESSEFYNELLDVTVYTVNKSSVMSFEGVTGEQLSSQYRAISQPEVSNTNRIFNSLNGVSDKYSDIETE